MRKDQVDLQNAVVWIPDSKTANGIAEVPLTSLAIEAFKSQMAISGEGAFLFPSDRNPNGHQAGLKTVWRKTLRRANVPYFRIYDLRSTYATRLSAGGVADEWVTQMLRQGDAQVFFPHAIRPAIALNGYYASGQGPTQISFEAEQKRYPRLYQRFDMLWQSEMGSLRLI